MLNHFTRGVQSLKKTKPFSHLKYSSMDFSIPHLTTNPKQKKYINTYSRINRLNTPNSKTKHTQQQNASSFSSEKPLNQSTKIFINQQPTNIKHHNNCNVTTTFKPKRNNNSTFLSVEPTSLIHKFYYFTDKTHIKSKAKKTRQHNIINLSHSKANNHNNNLKTESTSISTTSIKPIISNFISLRNCCSVEKNYIKSRNSNMSTYNSNNNKNTNHGLLKRNIFEINNSNNHSNIINYNNVPKTSCAISSFEAIQIEIDRAMKTKNKKYFVLKKALESMLEFCSENNYDNSLITLLEKIISITHLIYMKYTNEITNLKHLNDEYIKQIDTLTREYENKQQTLILVYSNEIQSLKKKIELLTRNTTTSEHISESSSDNNNNKEKRSTINNSKIACINKENLSDLDALYFFDKVQMKTVNELNKCALIPILPLAISKNESGGTSPNNNKINISLEHVETSKNNNQNKEYRINEYRKVK